MFEGFKKRFMPQAEDTLEEANKKRDRLAAGSLAAVAVAAGAGYAQSPELPKMPEAPDAPPLAKQMGSAEMNAPHQMDAKGTTVKLEGDNATVTIPAMPEPVAIDLREPTVIDATGATDPEALARQADALERQYEDLAGRSGQVAEVIVSPSPGAVQTEAENKARIERALRLMNDLQGRM